MPSAAASCTTAGQHRLHLFVGTGNDVSSNEAVTHALAGIGTGTNSGIHSTGFATHHHRDVATTYVLTADEAHLSSLGHGIGGLNSRNHAAGFDHAQGHTGNDGRGGGSGFGHG